MSSPLESSKRPAVKVFVATTVMLTFISFWRAAAIVLSDLASSAYYAGGDRREGHRPERSLVHPGGHAVQLRACGLVYIESSSMFVRGGVYRVVKEAHGRNPGEVFGFGSAVRLRPDRSHQRASSQANISRDSSNDTGRYRGPSIRCTFPKTHSPPASAQSSRFTSGGRISRAFTSPARRPCRS